VIAQDCVDYLGFVLSKKMDSSEYHFYNIQSVSQLAQSLLLEVKKSNLEYNQPNIPIHLTFSVNNILITLTGGNKDHWEALPQAVLHCHHEAMVEL
jgi:hypothetical protein